MVSPSSFTFLRLFGDSSGTTHFEDVETPLEPTGLGPLSLGALGSSGELRVLYGTSELDSTLFHAAPTRQFFVVISGIARVTATDGTTRELAPGTVLWLDDIGSDGHATEIVTPQLVALVFVT